MPYLLAAPAAITIAAVLGYPLYFLGKLSFQRYGLPELIAHEGTWVGTDNFSRLIHDDEFWRVLWRTIVFTFGAVSLTMILGTLIALLLARLGSFMRLFLTTGLVLVWAMPVVVAVNIWVWMFDFEFGIFNWALTELGVGDYIHHDWFENPTTGLAIIMAVVVWGAIPFVAITVFAGLTQVPKELVEAASIDGANGRARLPRHHAAAPEADLRHPDEPLDHLGLPGLQPGLDHARQQPLERLLPDEHLRLRGVVPPQ